MTCIEHKVGDSKHAADIILEYIGAEEDNGFYFQDETEANVHGPYDSISTAVSARNTYFENL
jgi:hypothetical protein